MAGEALNWPWIYLDRTGYEWKENERQLARVGGGKVGNVTSVMIVPTRKGAREGDWGRRSTSCVVGHRSQKDEPRRRSGVDWQGLIGERVVLRRIWMDSQWLACLAVDDEAVGSKEDEAERKKKGA